MATIIRKTTEQKVYVLFNLDTLSYLSLKRNNSHGKSCSVVWCKSPDDAQVFRYGETFVQSIRVEMKKCTRVPCVLRTMLEMPEF